MHYVNPLADWPSKDCVFGDKGWHSPEKNIILAINNYTRIVDAGFGEERDYSLRFLVHYLGDLRQPLHLTGREKGGNGIKVRFEKRLSTLHGVWDDRLITKAVREIANYSEPVPEKRIERALRGTIYDPYVRFIAKEGLLGWWKDEYPSWSLCPNSSPERLLTLAPPQTQLGYENFSPLEDDPDLPACPMHWARPLHALNCEITFPPELDTPNPYSTSILARILAVALNPLSLLNVPEYLELDTPQYAGRIRDIKLVERLLAMGGVRLAAVLNDIFDPDVGSAAKWGA